MMSLIPLVIVLFIGGALVYVIWKFSNAKSVSHGIDVITGDGVGISDRDMDEDLMIRDESVDEKLKDDMSMNKTGELKKLDSNVEEECIQMIVKNPRDLNAYLRLSVFYIQRKKWNDAKEVLLEAKKVDEKNDKILNNMGIVWYKMKRYNNAVSAFEEAIKLNDKVAHRFVNLGLCYYALGESAKASKSFSKAVALDPEHRDYQELLAETKSVLV